MLRVDEEMDSHFGRDNCTSSQDMIDDAQNCLSSTSYRHLPDPRVRSLPGFTTMSFSRSVVNHQCRIDFGRIARRRKLPEKRFLVVAEMVEAERRVIAGGTKVPVVRRGSVVCFCLAGCPEGGALPCR